MANYDFQTILSPLDFEHLVRDLVSKDIGSNLTSFAEGKDSGIDLRYSKDKTNTIIVQCKRVKFISKKQIQSELSKIKCLNPNKYYFVVSVDLSPAKFDFIKDTFKDWMENDSNIYTRSRLNQLLDKYKAIHQKHYKLWLNTATIFNELINQPLYERAKSLISEIKKNYKYYVRNESLDKSIEILNKNHFVVISGIPGIGKTTLAELILWEYLQIGFEIIEIHNVEEGEQILAENSERNQVFYFDDFLGENFLKFDVIGGRSNDLVKFINRIRYSKNTFLVMTTREYILNQAKEVYEKLNLSNLNIAKYTLDLSNYSRKIRAQILYNHLYYSDVPIEFIKSIIDNYAYSEIISHKNYNPRIIEQLTSQLTNIEASNYASVFKYNLDYPFSIWDRAFNSQISKGSKFALYLLLSVSKPILLSEFKEVQKYFYQHVIKGNNLEFSLFDFKRQIKELEGSFIKVNVTNREELYIDFLNPSIKDFLLSIIKSDKEILLLLIKSCIYFDQFIYTIRYLVEKFIDDKVVVELIDSKIISNFYCFLNFSNIYSNVYKKSSRDNTIYKIHNLKFYIKISKNKLLHQTIFEEFEKIDLRYMPSSSQRKYIFFFIEYQEEIKIKYLDLIDNIVKNIIIYDHVNNLTLLRDIDEDVFDRYIFRNKKLIFEKIKNSIINEFELLENELDQKYFVDSFYSENVLSIYNLNASEFGDYLNIEEDKIELIPKLQRKIKTDNNDYLEYYDASELFNIDMF